MIDFDHLDNETRADIKNRWEILGTNTQTLRMLYLLAELTGKSIDEVMLTYISIDTAIQSTIYDTLNAKRS